MKRGRGREGGEKERKGKKKEERFFIFVVVRLKKKKPFREVKKEIKLSQKPTFSWSKAGGERNLSVNNSRTKFTLFKNDKNCEREGMKKSNRGEERERELFEE